VQAKFHGPIYQHRIDLLFWAVQINFHGYRGIEVQQRAWVSVVGLMVASIRDERQELA